MKEFKDFDDGFEDKVFLYGYRLKCAGFSYVSFCRLIKKKHNLSQTKAREYWERINDFVNIMLSATTETVRNEIVLKLQDAQKCAKKDKAHNARVSAIKLEAELRLGEAEKPEEMIVKHVITMDATEPEGELNQEVGVAIEDNA